MSRKRRLILLSLSLVVVLLLAAGGAYVFLFGPTGSDPTSGVRTFRVARGTVKATATASGTVEPRKSANVDFGTSGTVEKVNVTEGDTVSKGEVLARLDDSAQRNALTAARSKLTAAEDSLAALEDEETCDDSTSSSTAGAGSGSAGGGQVSCKTQSQVSSAQADVDSAQASVSQAKADLAATKLKAPMSGTVVAVNGTVGSMASAGSSGSGSSGSSNSSNGGSSSSTSSGSLDTDSGFVVIAKLHDLVVDASLAEADVAKIRKSQHATVTFPALTGKSAKGKVTSIDLTGTTSNNVVSYGVTVTLSSVPKALRLGQSASVSIVTAKASNVLYVPTVAVQKKDGTSTVQLVQNRHLVTRTVKTGIEGDLTTEITAGLKEGDQVVLVTDAQASRAGSNQNGQGGGVVRKRVPKGGGSGPTLVQRP